MKHMLLVIMIAALWGCPGQMQAQGVDVRPLEGEFFLGTSAPLFGYHGGKSKLGVALGLELRCNVEDSPVDVGVLLDITSAEREYSSRRQEDGVTMGPYRQNNRTATAAVVCDYNFNQGGLVNPFIGIGYGTCLYTAINQVVYDSDGKCMVFIPRVGVELFRHLRVTWSSHLSRKGYHNVSLAVGLVLGGNPRKLKGRKCN